MAAPFVWSLIFTAESQHEEVTKLNPGILMRICNSQVHPVHLEAAYDLQVPHDFPEPPPWG